MDVKSNSYQVIPRKYRPQTFGSVVGQEAIVKTLKNALHLQRLAHAYLFCGCRGTGKTTLARVFSKALNCHQLTQEDEPCNQCPSCLEISSGKSLDVLEIDGASNRGIDDIRQINETIGYTPASGKYKIYIIDEVHMLTKEAFNALLKTLEEPPKHVKFLFATTEPHKVLPTIVSRCQRFDLNRISPEALQKKLNWIAQDLGVDCEEEAIAMIAHLSEGSLRDAESLLDQIICYTPSPITATHVSSTLGLMSCSVFFKLDHAFQQTDLSYAFELADRIFSSGKDFSYFIDNLIEHYRYHLKVKLGAALHLFTEKLKEEYKTTSCFYTEEQCLYILDFLLQWQQQMSKTVFKRINLEMVLLHIIRSKQRLTLPTLVKRLTELEQKTQQSLPPKLDNNKAASETLEKTLPKVEIKHFDSLEKQTKEENTSPLSSVDSLSLEESLLKKIKNKIAETKPLVETVPSVAENLLNPEQTTTSLLLSKKEWESVAQPSTSPEIQQQSATLEPSSQSTPTATESDKSAHSRYDTLMRFAAVELEGIIKKEKLHG